MFKAKEPEDLDFIPKKPSYALNLPTSNMNLEKQESWSQAVKTWNSGLEDTGKVKSPNELAREIREAGTTSVLAFIQMPIETVEVVTYILTCQRNAIRRLSAFLLINKALEGDID